MIEIKKLYKTYGAAESRVEALKNINLTIESGEIYGIIGLSGAGKSSLVRCINLLEQPDSGKITVNEMDMMNLDKRSLRAARKKIGMIFQHFNLLMNSTVYENIAFPLTLEKKSSVAVEKRVEELLKLVGLEDKRNAYPSMLSGGQKQRVGIARAIAAEPDLIICDEATSALDPETTDSILRLLKVINEKLKMTIIIITHEMEVIKKVCDRVSVLEDGEIVESGEVIDICINPKTKTARSFFRDIELDTDIIQDAVKKGGTVIRAIFKGENSTDPFIYQMIKKYDVETAILLGGIQHLDNSLLGNLVLSVRGGKNEVESAIKYLTDNGIIVEVLANA